MTTRTIIAAHRSARSTFIKFECGHERSIGGHVWPSGKPVGDPRDLVRFKLMRDCQDGACGGYDA